MTNELLQKYLEGSCSAEERAYVLQWLQQQDMTGIDDVLQQRWVQATERMPEPATKALWQQLQEHLPAQVIRSYKAVVVPLWIRRIGVAVVVMGLVLTTTLLFEGKQATSKSPAVATVAKDTHQGSPAAWETLHNEQLAEQKHTLEDGSVVVLMRHTSIRYRRGFEKNSRRIQLLNGTALFTAASDKQRPFSVLSGDVTTTALGTTFRVKYHAASPVTVQLLKGKVKVQQSVAGVPDVYLVPGQQCIYTVGNDYMAVSRFAKDKLVEPKPMHDHKTDVFADTLLFDQTPLATVLQQLQQRYHTVIDYNHTEITDVYFSGKVTSSDSLPVVLRIIARMNALQLNRRDDGFQLSKP